MHMAARIILIVTVLHPQLAVDCHCVHGGASEQASAGCRHVDAFPGHPARHPGHGGLDDATHDHEPPTSSPCRPCDGCPECQAVGPLCLPARASLQDDLDCACIVRTLLFGWAYASQNLLIPCQPSAVWGGPQSLLDRGTLLRI